MAVVKLGTCIIGPLLMALQLTLEVFQSPNQYLNNKGKINLKQAFGTANVLMLGAFD
jgi:hypothetical protein